MDRDVLLKKIDSIKSTVKGKLPNIYIIHGDMTDEEMNWLYNHPKVKVMVTHTRGEGFGRPLLEFSMVAKPIIASGWSGQIDFLNPSHTYLLSGTVESLHPSSVLKNVLLKESQWFKPDDGEVGKAYSNTFKHYKKYVTAAKKLRFENKNKFNFDKMVEKLDEILIKHASEVKAQPKLATLQMPKLKTNKAPGIKLPKLKKL